MAKWKTIVEKHQRESYRWPAGWDSREKVAAELECSPDRVASLLAPGIKAGTIESRPIRVWDDAQRRVVTVIGYRQVPRPGAADGGDGSDLSRVMAVIRRYPGASASYIRDRVPKDIRAKYPAREVAKLMA
ncbi:MAG: hypothetical protein FGM22_08355 [Burkholderiaceae bacterium]|nr:hypothetical protein [Burkholderiaceae bacterium]